MGLISNIAEHPKFFFIFLNNRILGVWGTWTSSPGALVNGEKQSHLKGEWSQIVGLFDVSW